MPTAAQLSEQARVVKALRRRLQRDIDAYVARVDFGGDWKPGMAEFLEGLAERYGDVAATVAADFFEQVTGENAVLATLDAAAVRRVIGWALDQSTSRDQLASMSGAAVGQQMDTMRVDTTHRSAKKHHLKYAIVPQGDTCAFCLMRAGRGFVYWTAEAAKAGHDWCNCIPCVETDEGAENYHPDEYHEMYLEGREKASSGSTKAILAGMRDALGVDH